MKHKFFRYCNFNSFFKFIFSSIKNQIFCDDNCKSRIFTLKRSFNENILLYNVFARNVRNVVYFCKHTFNNYIFDIIRIA